MNENTKKTGKIDRIEMINTKLKTTTTKNGKTKKSESGYIFRVRAGGAWLLIPEAIKAGALPPEAEAVSGSRSKNEARATLPQMFHFAGLSVPASVSESAKDAQAKLNEAEAKREAKRKAIWEAGRASYLKDARTKAGARFDKLEAEYGENIEA